MTKGGNNIFGKGEAALLTAGANIDATELDANDTISVVQDPDFLNAYITGEPVATESYVDNKWNTLGNWQAPVIARAMDRPNNPQHGDRYLIDTTPASPIDFVWIDWLGHIVEYRDVGGSITAFYTAPTDGMVTMAKDTDFIWFYNGSDWVRLSVQIDHNATLGLQGGSVGQRNHLTNAQVTDVNAIPAIQTTLGGKIDKVNASIDTTSNTGYGFRMNINTADAKMPPAAADKVGDVFNLNVATPTVTNVTTLNPLNPPAIVITRRGVPGQAHGAGAAFTLEKVSPGTSDSNSALRLQLLTGGNSSYADIIRFRHNGVEFMNQTGDTVPYLNSSKILTSSAVTPTELGLLTGLGTVTLKDQLAAKLGNGAGVQTITGTASTIAFTNSATRPTIGMATSGTTPFDFSLELNDTNGDVAFKNKAGLNFTASNNLDFYFWGNPVLKTTNAVSSVLVTNESRRIVSSTITTTELGYLAGLTGGVTIKDQLANRLLLTPPTTTETQTVNSRVKIAIDAVGSFEFTSPGSNPGIRIYNVGATMRSDIRQDKTNGDLILGIGTDASVDERIRLVRATGGIKLGGTTASRVLTMNAANEIATATTVTPTQLESLSSITGNVQTRLNALEGATPVDLTYIPSIVFILSVNGTTPSYVRNNSRVATKAAGVSINTNVITVGLSPQFPTAAQPIVTFSHNTSMNAIVKILTFRSFVEFELYDRTTGAAINIASAGGTYMFHCAVWE